MNSFAFLKSLALSSVLSSAAIAVVASSAVAMPIDDTAVMGATASLQRVSDQHRVYPGSESAAAEKARAEHNAPNRACEKQQQYCE